MASAFFNLLLGHIRLVEDGDFGATTADQVFTLYVNIPLFQVPPDEAQILRERIFRLKAKAPDPKTWNNFTYMFWKAQRNHLGTPRPEHYQFRELVNTWRPYYSEGHLFALEKWSGLVFRDFEGVLFMDLWFADNVYNVLEACLDTHKGTRFQCHVLEGAFVSSDKERRKAKSLMVLTDMPKYKADVRKLYDRYVKTYLNREHEDLAGIGEEYRALCEEAFELDQRHRLDGRFRPSPEMRDKINL